MTLFTITPVRGKATILLCQALLERLSADKSKHCPARVCSDARRSLHQKLRVRNMPIKLRSPNGWLRAFPPKYVVKLIPPCHFVGFWLNNT